MQRIRPLALAEGTKPQEPREESKSESPEPAFDEAPDFVMDATAPHATEPKGPVSRFERWQRRLLDLSLRNNLLNFRASKRVVELIVPDPGTLEDMLAEGHRFRLMPGIEQQGNDPREYSLYGDRHHEDLIQAHALDVLKNFQLLAPLTRQELDTRLLELYRAARSAIEEGGANTLFLVLGFLSWRHKERDKPCKAPLVLIPLRLERKSIQSGFQLSLHDDEPRFNLTLLEMLRRDFEISALDSFERELPKDERGLDIEFIWRTVQTAIRDIPGWEVSRNVTIGLFSFAKYLMWKDLVDRTETLKENPVVRHLLDTLSERYRDEISFLDPKDLDKNLSPQNVFCPLPVDSSQLSAIATAAQGKDFVLIGPPGTGKSQTISNMIAQCLAQGKTVLFVAEKTAALNVVYRRLKAIGLGEFCLELHSHKARKLEVLGQLRNAYEVSEDFVENLWNLESIRLSDLQDKLNEYVQAIHCCYPNGLTPYKAIGTVVKRTDLPFIQLSWPSYDFHDQTALDGLRQTVDLIGLHGTTARNLELTPLWAVQKSDWSPRWQSELVEAARELGVACNQLESAAENIRKVTGIPTLPLDANGRESLEALSRLLPRAAGKDWRLTLRPDAASQFARLREAVTLVDEYQVHAANLSLTYRREALQLDHSTLQSIWQLSEKEWLRKLKEALDLFLEYVEQAGRLSISYKSGVYNLDLTALQSMWELSRNSWWLRRNMFRRRVKKALCNFANRESNSIPDCENDLRILTNMRDLQNRMETLDELGEEAVSLWLGTLDVPQAKISAFHEALNQAISQIPDVPGAPVSLAGLLDRVLGPGQLLPMQSNMALGAKRGDVAFSIKNKILRTLQEVSESGGSAIPDCEKDLRALTIMRLLRDQILSFDDLIGKTAGLWSGLNTDGQGITLAASFYEDLLVAVARFVDKPETMVSLQTALEYLLGPGNVTLGHLGSAGEAMAFYLKTHDSFRSKCEVLSNLAGETGADWVQGDLSSIADICKGLVSRESDIHDWCAWLRVKGAACDKGLAALVDAVVSGAIEPEKVKDAFDVNYCRWWIIAVAEDLPILRSFVAIQHERSIKDFQYLNKKLRNLSRLCIRTRLCTNKVDDDENGAVREWGVLQREMAKKKRHMPLRLLIGSIPSVLTRLTPCLLMSPLSIAQYLAPGMALFDLIIFDEASQIPVWDAIGAMARGKRVVVVGDPKQLPPTNFFTRSEDEQADDEATHDADMESVLDECLGSSLPDLRLRWHYRSRHESLITFSNHRYYGGELVTFPAPHSEDSAVSYTHVHGIYQRGASRTNPIEARAVVAHIISRLRDPSFVATDPPLSIGVVTFNSEQQRYIEDLFEAERRKDKNLEQFFSEDLTEPIFVKNLESVQGDERDIIYFSTTYGPDQSDRISMHFGPLNKDGGERRLNVAVTRARHELRVFSSLQPDQIDITRTNALGVRDLRLFLEFAQRGARVFAEEVFGSLGDFESPFEHAVATELGEKGWQVHPQVGVSAFRIDLGILDPDVPGEYLAGVECDGATYHRAATARDRDKLREQVLRELGWEIIRVWSTEWWTSRERAINKLHDQLTRLLNSLRDRRAQKAEENALQQTLPEGLKVVSIEPNEGARQTDKDIENHADDQSLEDVEAEPLNEDKMLQAVISMVENESPIHEDVLAHRAARKMGFFKAGRRIREAVFKIAKSRYQTTREDVGLFFWNANCEVGHCVSCRPGSDGNPRFVNQVAMPELMALARSISPQFGEDPVVLMARHLGLKRLRTVSRPRLEKAWADAASF